MRVHLNTDPASTERDIRAALQSAIDAGKVSRHVDFDVLVTNGSRSHQTGATVHLEAVCGGTRSGCTAGHRWANTGKYGADSNGNGNGTRAATYDEWGWFLAYLFAQHPDAWAGHYKGLEGFHFGTRNPGAYLLDQAPVPA